MNHTKLIIAREFLTKVKNKSFLLMTILTPIIIGLLIFIVVYLTSFNNDTLKTITVADNTSLFANSLKGSGSIEFNFIKDVTKDEAKVISINNNDYGMIFIPQLEDYNNVDYEVLSEYSDFKFVPLLREKR